MITQRSFPDAGDFFLNYTLKFDMALPDKQPLRVCPVTNPICPTKANLNRDIGDTVQLDIGPAIGLAMVAKPLEVARQDSRARHMRKFWVLSSELAAAKKDETKQ